MAEKWETIPINEKVNVNVAEEALRRASATLENAFINESKGHSRFPGLTQFADLGTGRVYLHDWKGDLIAVTSTGKVYRIDKSGNATDSTGAVPSGGKRVLFDKTDDELVMAAGGEIIKLAGEKTERLSENAPLATHIGYLDGRLLANEINTQRFRYTEIGDFDNWQDLNVFSAEAAPDPLVALVVTKYREVLMGGTETMEQWEPYPGGTQPYFRRWGIGEGILAPYTFISEDAGTWAVTDDSEFVRFVAQGRRSEGDAVDRQLESISLDSIEDWDEAWAAKLHIQGQKFIVLSVPEACNPYGTDGITFLFDYRRKSWSYLYGWDSTAQQPTRWPGWSVHQLWGRNFVGGDNGIVYELKPYTHDQSDTQRMYWRSGLYDGPGQVQVLDVRLRLRRGASSSNTEPVSIEVRAKPDNRHWSRWVRRSLGLQGDGEPFIQGFGSFGQGLTWQFEYRVTDGPPVEVLKFESRMMRVD